MDYDAVIIGSGLGGCAAGAALAGKGKKVLILEKMDQVGGRCSTGKKNGFDMDTGSHMIWRSSYGPFTEALKRVNKEDLVGFHHIVNMLWKVGDTPLKFNFADLFAAVQKLVPVPVIRMFAAALPLMTKILDPITQHFDNKSIQDVMTRITGNTYAHNLIDWVCFILFGTPYMETPAGELMRTVTEAFGPLFNGLADGNMMIGYIEGGLIQIPKALCEGIKEHGGEIHLGVEVTNIIIVDGMVAGVKTDKGEFIEADLVLSNAGIKETVKYLVGEEHFTKKYTDYIRSLKPGCSGMALRLALDAPVVPYDLIFNIPEKDLQNYYQHMWYEHKIPDGLPAIMATTPSRMDPSLAPEGKESLIAIAPLTFEPEENWPKWEQKMLDAVEDALPGIKEHIMWHDFLTPGSYLVFGEEESPAIGIAQCMGQAGADRPSSISPINGLYYIGAEAGKNASGVATEVAIQSGLNCADYLLAKETENGITKILSRVSRKSVLV